MADTVVETLWGRIEENLHDRFEEARTLNEASLGYKQDAEAAATSAGSAAKAEVDKLKAGAPAAFDTLLEIANELEGNATERAALANSIALKADTAYVNTEVGKKANSSHTHTVAQISNLPEITTASTGGALVQRFSDGNITTTLPSGNYNVTPKIYVDRRPALFSGAGSPPSTITGAVAGDWWLDETSMEIHKITGV